MRDLTAGNKSCSIGKINEQIMVVLIKMSDNFGLEVKHYFVFLWQHENIYRETTL